MTLKPSHVETETRKIPEKELLDLFAILPIGRENAKTSEQLAERLSSVNGRKISSRRIKEGIRQLRHYYGKCLGGLPGQGFFKVQTKEDLNIVIAYLDRQIGDIVSTRDCTLNNFYGQPSQAGEQLDFLKPVEVGTEGRVEKIPGSLILRQYPQTVNLPKDIAYRAIYLYWKTGYTFEKVAEKLREEFEKQISSQSLHYFWDKLSLPRSKRGGHGVKTSQALYEESKRRLDRVFKEEE